MKKAIILITSLFFVMFISFAMLENLKSSERLIESSNENFSQAQMLILIDNYKDEIGSLLVKNKDNLDDIIYENTSLEKYSLDFYDIKSSFELIKLKDLYNINDIFSTQNDKQAILESYFIQNGIDYENFKAHTLAYLESIDEEIKSFTSLKQVHTVLDNYSKKVQVYDLKSLKEGLYFMDFSENRTYVLCNLNLEVYNKRFISTMIFDMQSIQNNRAGVVDFDIVFQ